MTLQEEVQLKVLAMQASAGNYENAVQFFDWISNPVIEAEVQRRLAIIVARAEASQRAE